jgi:imidazolonepropionase
MAQPDLLITNTSQLLTLAGGPQRGDRLGELSILEDGAAAIANGEIVGVGSSAELMRRYKPHRMLDAGGHVALPGFVDPHAHLIWAGDRAAEFEMRLSGMDYMQILAAGGGILSTVSKTRQASLEQLIDLARPRIGTMLAYGTTTAEAKTGYGLQTETELRMLRAILALDDEGPMELAPTFLGAHAIPVEYRGNVDDYVALLCEEMLPAVKQEWRTIGGGRDLPFVDVFCEEGAFDLEQTRLLLETARDLGFPLKVHADEFKGLGGTGLAVELGAVSADHLVHTPRQDIAALGKSNTVAVALPGTPFGLAEQSYTPAASLLEANAILALATDLNPGTAWCESMQFMIALACRYMGLTPAQAIAAATINAAAAIGRQDRIGSLEAGKQADLIILNVADYRHLGYRFGANLVDTVVKRGEIVIEGGREIWTSRQY